MSASPSGLKQSSVATATSYTQPSDYNVYKIVTYVLAGVCFLLVLIIAFNIYKIHSTKQNKIKKMAVEQKKGE